MHTALFTHPECLNHDTPLGHPESSDRLRSVLHALEGEAFMLLDRREAPLATPDQVARIHPRKYVDAVIAAVPRDGLRTMDSGDTIMSPGTGAAILRASGAVCAAVDAVLTGETRNAFCAVRPPGHHAETATAMGFCLFNSVAVAAAQARAVHGVERVAVVDFDVHHGNGTQDLFWNEPGLFYASSHEYPLFPGTGQQSETGVADNILNVHLAPGTGGAEFRAAYTDVILPRLKAFQPELLILSAGFDAHRADPLATLEVTTADFAWLSRELLAVADQVCAGRVVSALEGGYNLNALADSVMAHIDVLMAA